MRLTALDPHNQSVRAATRPFVKGIGISVRTTFLKPLFLANSVLRTPYSEHKLKQVV